MIPFLRHFCETVKAVPDRSAVVDRDGTRTTTYQELYTTACKVNGWLRAHGIRREDVCAIYLPKGMELLAVRLGVMMAGCAWVVLEDFMGKERIEYVIRDSGCKAVRLREKSISGTRTMPNATRTGNTRCWTAWTTSSS